MKTAATAFLDRPDLSPASRRSYAQTLQRLTHAIGDDRSLETFAGADVETAVQSAWGHCAPATWNRHVATVRSFIAFCRRHGWLAEDAAGGLDRRREPADRTRAIPRAELERLWRRENASVRERAFWRLCYETAGRAAGVLGPNIEDVDLANKRARVRSKGGDIEFLHFQSASARLLPKLIAGRSRGPLFLAERRPVHARAPAAVDLCPVTGHGRLSYRQAEALFRTTSGGWTLHQLRHSALTHLAEANVALPLLMAKSRHVSLRSLQRDARPGPEAVAALTQRMTQHGGGAERLRMTRLSADERRVLVERLFDQRRTGLPAEEVSRAASYGGTVTSARLLTLARLSARAAFRSA